MSLRKTATKEAPHALYESHNGQWTWRVLKVNAPAKGPKAQYATWFCLVTSPMVGPSGEMGDTYIAEVLEYATLTSATDEFLEYIHEGE